MYRLIFQSGAQRGRRVAIRQGPVILGRHPDCTIRLTSPEVALQHAILEDQPAGGVRIRRLADEAELQVNRQLVTEAELRDGDVIEIGSHALEFRGGAVAMAPKLPVSRRHSGWLQKVTMLAVGLLLAGQLIFLFAVSVWRQDRPFTRPAIPAPVPASLKPGTPVMAMAGKTAATTTPHYVALPSVTPLPLLKPPPVLYAAMTSNRQLIARTAVTSAPVAAPEAAAFSNEIKKTRMEIVQLRHEVEALPKPVPMAALPIITNAVPANPALVALAPASATNAVNAEVEPEDLIRAQAQRMFKKTMGHMGQLEPDLLDAELETIQNMAPEFMPPFIERAQLMDRRGLAAEALGQWRQIQKLAKTPELQTRAEEEIARLEKRLSALRVRETESRKTNLAVATAQAVVRPVAAVPSRRMAAHPQVRLMQVEPQKLMAGEKYDEMRLLRITAAPVPGESGLAPSAVEVVVTFYDRGEKTGRVAPSHAVVPGAPLHAASTIGAVVAPLEFSATYLVPSGSRQLAARQSGEEEHYYGYRVELLYRGELQDLREHPLGMLPPE